MVIIGQFQSICNERLSCLVCSSKVSHCCRQQSFSMLPFPEQSSCMVWIVMQECKKCGVSKKCQSPFWISLSGWRQRTYPITNPWAGPPDPEIHQRGWDKLRSWQVFCCYKPDEDLSLANGPICSELDSWSVSFF